MGYDGYLKFGTKLDNSGFENGMQAMSKVAKRGAVAVTAAVGTSIGAAVKVGAQFESSMSQVGATMGLTAQQIAAGDKSFKVLEQAAKEAGETTQFSASQSSEALNYLALAGYDAEKSIKALPNVLNVAASGGLELGYASDLVTDSMSALGLKIDELSRFTDELAKTSQKSNTNVGQLGEAILTVGGTAKDLAGGTIELNTALGILADNGIKGAEGGTALRNVILSLTAPTDKAAEKMEELGLKAFDTDGNLRPLNETFQNLDGKLSSMSKEEKTNVLNTIFNKVDLKSAEAMLANCGGRFDELSGYIANADGAAEDMAETMNDNLKGQITILGSSLEGLGIQTYEKFENPMKKAAKTAIDSVSKVTSSMKSGKLSESMDDLAESTGNVMEEAAILAAKSLPKLINGFVFVAKHGKEVVAMLATAKVAMVGFKNISVITGVINSWKAAAVTVKGYSMAMAANNAVAATGKSINMLLVSTMSAQEVVVGVLTGKITLATAAQTAWNAVMVANPIGAVVVGVAALTAGLVVLNHKQDETSEKAEKIADTAQEERRAWEDLKNTQKEQIETNIAEINSAQKMLDELSGLVDANGKVGDSKERVKYLTEQINEIAPDSIKWLDSETISIEGNIDALRRQLKLKEAQAVFDGMEQQRAEAEKAKTEILQRQVEIQENIADAEREIEKIRQEIAKGGSNNRLNWLSLELEGKQKYLDGLQSSFNQEKSLYEEKTQFLDYYNRMGEALANENYEEMARVMAAMNLSLKDAGTATDEELKNQIDNLEALYNLLVNTYGDSTSEAIQTQRTEIGELLTACKEEVKKRSIQTGEATGEGVTEGIENKKEDVRKKSEEVSEAITSGIEEAEPTMVGVGSFLLQGLARGIEENIPTPVASAVKAAGSVMSAMTGIQCFDTHSPSKWSYKVGGFVMEGLANGIHDKASEAEKAATEMSKSIMSKAEEIIDVQKFYNKISSQEEAEFWEGMLDITELQAEEIKKVERNLYKAREKASKDSLKHSKEWIEKEMYYNRLSAKEKVEAWERVVNRKNLLNEEQLEAEKKLYDAQQELLEEQQSAVEEYEKNLQKRADNLQNFAGLFDKVKDDSEVTGKELLQNLRGQVSSFKQWQRDIDDLADKGVGGSLLEELRKMGPKAAQEIHALTRLSEDELDEYIRLYGEKANLATEQAQNEMGTLVIPTELGKVSRESVEKVKTALGERLSSLFGGTIQTLFGIDSTKEAKKELGGMSQFFDGDVVSPMTKSAEYCGENILKTVATSQKNIQSILSKTPEWTNKNVFEPLHIGMIEWANNMIETIEGLSNMGVSAINELIDRLNTIKISPPSWLEEEGYDSWRVELNTVSDISIPRLANGGVIPPGREQLFVAGDNKTENEIIAPESTFRDIVREEMERMVAKMCAAVEYENAKMATAIRAEASYKVGLENSGTVLRDSNNTDVKQGDFIVKIDRVVNSGKNSTESLLREMEFYRKQHAIGTGG